jgi:hypothetical protein
MYAYDCCSLHTGSGWYVNGTLGWRLEVVNFRGSEEVLEVMPALLPIGRFVRSSRACGVGHQILQVQFTGCY